MGNLIEAPDLAALPELYWVAIAACIFGFFMSFGIGANDVGNCFATTVAAKSLTLLQAVGVAAVFEFAGAALLGASVTKTIRSGILDMDAYEGKQQTLAFGMLVALVNASFWLILATAYGLPVSTTHTIIAAIVGFSIAAEGFDSIMWGSCSKIFISWVAAPAITGFIGYVMFWLVRTFVLKSDSPFNRAALTYSLTIFVTLTINIFFVMHKGLKRMGLDTGLKLAVSFGVSFAIALIFQFLIVGKLKSRIVRMEEERETAEEELRAGMLSVAEEDVTCGGNTDCHAQGAASCEKVTSLDDEEANDPLKPNQVKDETVGATFVVEEEPPSGFKAKMMVKLKELADATYNRDLEGEALDMDDDAADIWDKAEVYDAKAEILYSYLQVFTACCLSFAHGSNDVANAVAPICAVLAIYDTGVLSSKAPVPSWILVMGAFGIVVGLALFGYKVIISIGYRLTKLSPSRGFCIQLSTCLVVVTASYLGIPVSTTQSTIGGTIGVGAVEGVGGVQWYFMGTVFFGWVASFFITALTSAGIMAFCFYSPSSVIYYNLEQFNMTNPYWNTED